MKIIRLLTAFFLVFSMLFTVFYGANKITEAKPFNKPIEYKGIINLWQVDSFEGGTGSRKQFLLKAARGFEKQFEGVLIMVTEYSPKGIEESFNSGIYPDIVSFGNGVNITNFNQINCEKSVKGGLLGDKVYATAWCRGGYFLIAKPTIDLVGVKEIDCLTVSQGEFTEPLLALSLNGITVKNFKIKSPFDAYVDFVSGKTEYLLGTQRDIIRLENRGMQVNVRPLEKYNDLYQYVAVTGTDKVKNVYAERFIEYLVSEPVQSKLVDIGMFSCFYNVAHENESMKTMQNLTFEYTVSAFSSSETLKEIQRLSALSINGDEGTLRKIKNMLI